MAEARVAARAALEAIRGVEPMGRVSAAGQWAIVGKDRPSPPVNECVDAAFKARAAFTAMIDAILSETPTNG